MMYRRFNFAACAIAFALIAAFITTANAQVPPVTKDTIPQLSVRGEAELQKPADELQLSLGVVTENADANEALRQNSQRMNAVMSALTRVGLEEREYETGRFQIMPIYSQRPPRADAEWRQEIRGYRVTNSVRVKTQQLDLAGRIIAAANEAGANTVDFIHFGLANPRVHRAEAIAAATGNAVSDANALANAAGLRLVRIISINLDHATPIRPMMMDMMERGMAMAAPDVAEPPITPGDVTVRASVNVVYEIAPAE